MERAARYMRAAFFFAMKMPTGKCRDHRKEGNGRQRRNRTRQRTWIDDYKHCLRPEPLAGEMGITRTWRSRARLKRIRCARAVAISRRNFCPQCGSPLFTRGYASPGLPFVRFTTLDDASTFLHERGKVHLNRECCRSKIRAEMVSGTR